MESLPRGATAIRGKLLWEIGLHIASNPATPFGGDREISIAVGSGSGDAFRPRLRMATGSPLLAHAVARGDLEVAVVNPSGFLTQAYRGTGLFAEPLPVRILACYPSHDRFVCAIHPRTGLRSVAEIAEKRYPLRLSIREDPVHSTRLLLNQLLAAYGFSLADLESWGGSFQLNGPPRDARRLAALRDGTVDAVFDEGIGSWLPEALVRGFELVPLEDAVFAALQSIGWRRVTLAAGFHSSVTVDHPCLDYGGWPLYTRASLSDEDAYNVCAALQARTDEIPWEEGAFAGIGQLGRDTEATPMDVPLHPGAERWFREHGHLA